KCLLHSNKPLKGVIRSIGYHCLQLLTFQETNVTVSYLIKDYKLILKGYVECFLEILYQ
ncbi:hypothetical protein CEXT_43481, partial [Caerostris extrusa]